MGVRGGGSRRRRGRDVDSPVETGRDFGPAAGYTTLRAARRSRGSRARARPARVWICRGRVAATPWLRRGCSAEKSRGDAAAGTWMVRGDESGRRRPAATPRRGATGSEARDAAAAGATGRFKGTRRARLGERLEVVLGDGGPPFRARQRAVRPESHEARVDAGHERRRVADVFRREVAPAEARHDVDRVPAASIVRPLCNMAFGPRTIRAIAAAPPRPRLRFRPGSRARSPPPWPFRPLSAASRAARLSGRAS